ncbi:MAG: mechanosensitive ion channel family protein [Armatimonadota bacterium]|nr:mechanosensitive ion channel family protein [bacterium]
MSPLVRDIIEAGSVFGAAVVAAIIARVVLTRLADGFDQSDYHLVRDLLQALRLPVVVLILLGGAYMALIQVSRFEEYVIKYNSLFEAATAVVVLIAITGAVNLAIMWYLRNLGSDMSARSHLMMLKKLVILVVWIIGIIQILSTLGVKVTAVIASLGVAGLAVGLALQDTIANLFAGFYLVVDRTVRAGDYIKLDSGQEGFVELVGWRNTQIRLWANNIVLVPNAKLVQSIITNMTLPTPVLSVNTYGGVSYDSDLERVEKVAIEVAKDVLGRFPGGDLSFEPVLRYKDFADSNITFVVTFRATEVGAQYLLQHEYIKALHIRFRQENIEISYPVRRLIYDAQARTNGT